MPRLLQQDGRFDYMALASAKMAFRGIPEVLMDWIAEGVEGDWFSTKVVGVSYRNDDRTSRQVAIKKLEEQEQLWLDLDPTNTFDSHAIRVTNIDGRQIGFLQERLAGEISRAMERGTQFLCLVLRVTGEDQPRRGVNIAIVRWRRLSQ